LDGNKDQPEHEIQKEAWCVVNLREGTKQSLHPAVRGKQVDRGAWKGGNKPSNTVAPPPPNTQKGEIRNQKKQGGSRMGSLRKKKKKRGGGPIIDSLEKTGPLNVRGTNQRGNRDNHDKTHPRAKIPDAKPKYERRITTRHERKQTLGFWDSRGDATVG